MKIEQTSIEDKAGNVMERFFLDLNVGFTCECGEIMKKGNRIYQFHYTEPICEKCFNGLGTKANL